MSSKQQTLIVGWDGATFDLIRPWVEEGKLPNVARLMKEGMHGPLRSTLPYWTYPAWSSFLTGVNPGKHGIFDFTKRRAGTHEIEFVNGGHRKGPTFWTLLSQSGKKVVSISVPCTYPPEAVNGIMISGFDAPGLGAKGATADARAMHPTSLHEELQREVGGHPIGAFVVSEINRGQYDVAVDRVVETARKKGETAKYLAKNKEWDCLMILFGESDLIGHCFWKFCDKKSPLYEDVPGLEDSILRVYEELDRQLGDLCETVGPETRIMMMSDHGFGGVSNHILYPNCWLRERELLAFKGNLTRTATRVLDRVKLAAVAALPRSVKRMLFQVGRRSIGKVESKVRYGALDWTRTKAYFEENPYFPSLWINLKGRQPEGVVEPGDEYEEVCNQVIQELEGWKNPETGENIVKKAFRREEVYSGSSTTEAPDIIVDWNYQDGYSYAFKNSSKSPDLTWFSKAARDDAKAQEFFQGKSGTHRPDGIFVACGPGIEQGTVEGAEIIDMAPTLLYQFGLQKTAEMDGRVLDEVFTNAFREEVEESLSSVDTSSLGGDGSDYSDSDEDIIADRLKALGYIS